jgi:6-phosphofructokinase
MNAFSGRSEIKKKTEALFEKCQKDKFPEIETELIKLGYVQRGADPASAEFHHTGAGLVLDVEFDEDGVIHSYELLTTEEMDEKQRKFRW